MRWEVACRGLDHEGEVTGIMRVSWLIKSGGHEGEYERGS